MSVYDSYTTIAKALAAFALGKCRRHVEVGGHVIDLVQAVAEEGRAVVEPEEMPFARAALSYEARDAWDQTVASNVRNALAGLYISEPAEALEYARAKPAPVCPCCLRPEGPT